MSTLHIPLPQPDDLSSREKQDAMGAYFNDVLLLWQLASLCRLLTLLQQLFIITSIEKRAGIFIFSNRYFLKSQQRSSIGGFCFGLYALRPLQGKRQKNTG